jgi:hypothetical protein
VKVFVTACLFAGLIVFPASADIIYFKDGMKTICAEKAWEEGGEVKCEYAGWIISYQKNDVLRIVTTTRQKKAAQPKKNPKVSPTTTKSSITKKTKPTPSKMTGPVFYDPRRPYKYWADINSKHKSYKEAIQALAKKYKCTPEWIQTHMGDSNDLAQIHQNLANPQPEQKVTISRPVVVKASELLFYNPRRPFPYWTGKDSKHKSYKDAIMALAKEYERSPDWIKANMGSTNDLTEIHQNLRARTAADPAG